MAKNKVCLVGLLLFASSAMAQVQIAAVPKPQDIFKHLRLQAWTIRACNAEQIVRNMNEDEIYLAIPTIPFVPSTAAVEILTDKQQMSTAAQIVKYIGWGLQIAAPIAAFKVVAASPEITGGLVSAVSLAPVIQTQIQGNIPSISSLTENLLAGSVSVPAANPRDAGCVHWTAYSTKLPKKSTITTVAGTVK